HFDYDKQFMRMLSERLGYETPPQGDNPYLPQRKQLTYPKGGEENATGKEQQQAGVQTQRIGDGEGGTPAEAGAGGELRNAAEGQAPQKTLNEDVKAIEAMGQKEFADEMTKRGTMTPAAYKLGRGAKSIEEVNELKAASERSKEKGRALMKSGDLNA